VATINLDRNLKCIARSNWVGNVPPIGAVSLDRQRRQDLRRQHSYSHFRCTHTSGVLTLPVYSHFRRTRTPYMSSVFSRYPSSPPWSLRGSSHTPCVGSLFSVSGGRSTGHGDRKVGLWRDIIDCVEKNLQTSYRTLPLYFSFPLWNHSLPARLTQFLRLSS